MTNELMVAIWSVNLQNGNFALIISAAQEVKLVSVYIHKWTALQPIQIRHCLDLLIICQTWQYINKGTFRKRNVFMVKIISSVCCHSTHFTTKVCSPTM